MSGDNGGDGFDPWFTRQQADTLDLSLKVSPAKAPQWTEEITKDEINPIAPTTSVVSIAAWLQDLAADECESAQSFYELGLEGTGFRLRIDGEVFEVKVRKIG